MSGHGQGQQSGKRGERRGETIIPEGAITGMVSSSDREAISTASATRLAAEFAARASSWVNDGGGGVVGGMMMRLEWMATSVSVHRLSTVSQCSVAAQEKSKLDMLLIYLGR